MAELKDRGCFVPPPGVGGGWLLPAHRMEGNVFKTTEALSEKPNLLQPERVNIDGGGTGVFDQRPEARSSWSPVKISPPRNQ